MVGGGKGNEVPRDGKVAHRAGRNVLCLGPCNDVLSHRITEGWWPMARLYNPPSLIRLFSLVGRNSGSFPLVGNDGMVSGRLL